jgi:hypothetical protein
MWKQEYNEHLLEMADNQYDYLKYVSTCSFEVCLGCGGENGAERRNGLARNGHGTAGRGMDKERADWARNG